MIYYRAYHQGFRQWVPDKHRPAKRISCFDSVDEVRQIRQGFLTYIDALPNYSCYGTPAIIARNFMEAQGIPMTALDRMQIQQLLLAHCRISERDTPDSNRHDCWKELNRPSHKQLMDALRSHFPLVHDC